MSSPLCLYYYHGSRGESLDEPNAFFLPVSTLGDFLFHFPANEEGLHFRFQADDQRNGYVWKDVVDPAEVLPTYRGRVCAQVLRLGEVQRERIAKTNLKKKVVDKGAVLQYRAALQDIVQKQKQRQQLQRQQRQQNAREEKPSKSASPTPTAPQDFAAPQKAPDLMAFATEQKAKAAPAAKPSPPRPGVVQDDIDDDLDDGIGTPVPPAKPAPQAPAFANDLDFMMGQKTTAELQKEAKSGPAGDSGEEEELRMRHRPRIRNWATQNGKPKPLMNLLSTLDQVLYPGAKWKGYSIGDLLEPKKVRVAYLKAMQVVHADKITRFNLSLENQVIAGLVCSHLNEAYEVFKQENGL